MSPSRDRTGGRTGPLLDVDPSASLLGVHGRGSLGRGIRMLTAKDRPSGSVTRDADTW